MDKILVVIPYLASGAQGDELAYAVAGWRRHFKEDYLIVIVGDHHPVVETGDDIRFIGCRRIDEVTGEYRPALDVVHKIRVVREHFPDADGFIWAADDIYAVNDFDLADVRFLKMLNPGMDSFSLRSSNPWQRMMARTRDLLISEGYPTRNFAVHLPSWYDFGKLTEIMDRYGLDSRSYSPQALYYNIVFRDRIPFKLNLDNDNLKYGIYLNTFDARTLQRAFKTKIWINNSNVGYNETLFRMLDEHYNSSTL